MNTNSLISLILLLLIVTQGSDASLLSKLRSMAAVSPEVNGTQVSPSPAPMLNQHDDAEKPKKPKKSDNSTGVNQNVKVNPATDLNQGVVNETCEGSVGSVISRCQKEKMIGCLKHPETGSQDLIILVQNEGESPLNVSIVAPTSVKISTKELEIPQHKAKKVNASASVGGSLKIVLNAGSRNCVLHTAVPIPQANAVPIPQANFFRKIPYADQFTPIYGAYFMFAVVLIVGGTWACCKFGRKGRHDTSGVPYQELEMAVPVSASAGNGNGNGNGNAEEGWDQGWDDDWDEEGAVKTPGKHVGNVSGNGLTSRSSNKDGWENDWDD